MTTPIDIRCQDFDIVQSILERALSAANARVYVFGSRATGTTKRAADLDLAIDLGRALSVKEQLSLADQFEESDLPYRVDIVDMHTVSHEFKLIIEQSMRAFTLES